MHPRSLLLCALAACTLVVPAAAHATPPGANGPLFFGTKESYQYAVLDADGTVDDNANPVVWADGRMRGGLASSPDGHHMAYISTPDNRIGVSDTDGGAEILLPGTADARDLAFSPDGTRVAFTANDRVWVVAADGKSAPKQLGGTFVGADEVDWAQDDSEILMTAAGAGLKRDLYAMDPHTGAAHPLTATDTLDEREPSFAPDGAHVVFTVEAADGHTHLDVMDADGGNRHALANAADADLATWSPDGTRIAFRTQAPLTNEDVDTIKPDGTGRRAVASVDPVDLMWSIKPGTGNRPPAASFTVAPVQPYTGGDTVLTSTAADPDGTITKQEWDLDGDGQYDDATGPTAHVTFTTPGAHRVALRVRDDRASTATSEQTLTVLQGGIPGAAFAVYPASPVVDQPATFTAAPNEDPRAQVVRHQWDFDGDGTWDADTGASRTVQHVYTGVGRVTAKLRVTDADGDTAVDAITFDVHDEVRCGVERAGRLVLDGCLVVKGQRRIAPDGVTINGVTFGPADNAEVAIDVAAGRAVAVPKDVARAFLEGGGALPDHGERLPVSACGDDLGTAAPALVPSTDAVEVPFTLRDGKTFAGLRPSSVSTLRFGDGDARFDVSGLFPRLLLNWSAEARGQYVTNPDCAQRRLTVHVGSFVSRIIRIPEIRLEWTGGDRFDGIADIRLADVFGFPQIEGRVTAIGGRISVASFHFDPGRILSQGMSVSSADGTMRFDRGSEELELRTRMDTTLELFGSPFLGVQGLLRFSRDGLHIEGLLDLVGRRVGYGHLDINPDLSIDAGAEAEFRTGPVYLTGEAEGFLDVRHKAAELYGQAKLGIDGIGHLGGELVISTKGIGACGDFGPLHPGFTQRWGAHWPDIFAKSCDFGDVRVPRATAASAAAGAVRTVQVAGGQRGVVLVAKGRPGRAPRVQVTGPGGVTITSRADGRASRSKGARWIVVSDRRSGITNVLVVRPRGGRWRVRELGGHVLRSVGAANALPAVKVRARRTGTALRWTLRRIPGQAVRIVEEQAAGGRRVLTTTRSARGRIAYRRAKGARRIVAEVLQNGMLRTKVVVIKKV